MSMITDLNQRVSAEKPQEKVEFKPLPKGVYLVKIKEIKPWLATKKDIYVNVLDEKGWVKKDENGKKITEFKKDFTFYNAKISYEVLEGEYKGRVIFDNLTTHPNLSFTLQNFLWAVKMDGITVGEIPNKCVGAVLEVKVDIDTYTKEIKRTDNITGIETVETITNEVNRVKGYLRTDKIKEDKVIPGL